MHLHQIFYILVPSGFIKITESQHAKNAYTAVTEQIEGQTNLFKIF
jgi:hypothetical protein